MKTTMMIVALSGFVFGCQQDARLGGAAAAGGSCANECDGQSPDGCWCDLQCASMGDCCPDITTTCGSDECQPANDQCSEGTTCQPVPNLIVVGGDDVNACLVTPSTGICLQIPDPNAICPTVVAEVCGCDGETYANSCIALAAGVATSTPGACAPTLPPPTLGQACGGMAGIGCDAGEFCNYEIADSCGAADAMGVCETIPEVCTMQVDPVCGCDNNEYSNSCFANAAGVSVAVNGTCATFPPPAPPTLGMACDGFGPSSNVICDAGEFCKFDTSDSCGDSAGVCTEIPNVCTEEFNPVCGCDGTTYPNPCHAYAQGTSPSSYGSCANQPPTPPPSNNPNSCEGLCGSSSPTDGGCYCDDQCQQVGDCCADKVNICGGIV